MDEAHPPVGETTTAPPRPAGEFNRVSIPVFGACLTGTILGCGPFLQIGFMVFLGAISKDFGWSRTAVSVGALIVTLGRFAGAQVIGRLADRFGVRRVILPAVALGAAATMCIPLSNGSLVRFYAFCLLAALVGPIFPGLGKVLAGWFRSRLGMVFAVQGVTQTFVISFVLLQFANFLLARVGWLNAYVAFGLVQLLITLPVLYFFLQPPPVRGGAQASGAPAVEGLTERQVWLGGTIWLIVVAEVIDAMVLGGVRFHLITLMTDHGLSRQAAVNIMSTSVFGILATRPVVGYLLDRFDTPKVVLPFILGELLGLFVLTHSSTQAGFAAGNILMSIGQAGEAGVVGYFLARFFGLKSFGGIYATIIGLSMIFEGVGPVIMGAAFDRTGSYSLALNAFQAGLCLVMAMFTLLGPYRFGKAASQPPRA